jgi:hypothetical protein
MYDEVYSWFGCCTGTDITDCNVATACVPSKSMDECLEDESCYGDPLALAWYVTTFIFFLTFDLFYHQRQYFPSISSTPHRVRASFFFFISLRSVSIVQSPSCSLIFFGNFISIRKDFAYAFWPTYFFLPTSRVYFSSVTQFTPGSKTIKCSFLSSTVSKTEYYCTVNLGTTSLQTGNQQYTSFAHLRSG